MRLDSGRNLCHPVIFFIVPIERWGRGRLIRVGVLWLLRVELACRPVAKLAVLFLVTIVGIGPGFHWDVGSERIRGLVEAVMAELVGL